MSFNNPSHHTINMMNSNQSNFNNAFSQNKNMIPQRDTKNHGHIMHNNMNDNIVSEIVSEYTIHIDGIDRDTTVFPNPYKFTVSLGGPAIQTSNKYVDSSNNPIVTAGVPSPRIDVNFKNVKYIKLKYLMLPRTINYVLETDASGNKTWTAGTTGSTILAKNRYLLLRIKEIANDKLYSTNDTIKNDCFIIYRDSNYGDALNDLWFATQPVKIFYDNGLKNLTKLTIEILKPDGTDFRLLYNNATQNIAYTEINTNTSTSTPSSDFYPQFNENIQTNMEFEIGVCENQLNTQKNYR